MAAEITDRLQRRLSTAAAGERLDIILELREPEPPPAGADEAIREFRRIAERVASAAIGYDAHITAEAWINFTMRCDAPGAAVTRLAALPDLVRIDLPATIGGDA